MDAPEFDEHEMEERVAQIIENGYKGRLLFAKMMSMPGITFSKEQRAQIETLVESGDTEGARQLILDRLTEAFGDGEESEKEKPHGPIREIAD